MTAGRNAASIGRAIRHARHRRRLTQQQLADEIGADRSAISNWENGRHFPQRFEGLLEDVLGIRLDETEPERDRYELDARQRRLIRSALPDDDDYDRVVDLLEGRLIVSERGAEAPE